MIRVVLDTNVLVSALLFERGRLAWLRHGWQGNRCTPVLAQPTTRELLRVLGYPKFKLSPSEIALLLAERLPWSETWLPLACAAKVNALVSSEADLLALRDPPHNPLILDPAGFQIWLQQQPSR